MTAKAEAPRRPREEDHTFHLGRERRGTIRTGAPPGRWRA